MKSISPAHKNSKKKYLKLRALFVLIVKSALKLNKVQTGTKSLKVYLKRKQKTDLSKNEKSQEKQRK